LELVVAEVLADDPWPGQLILLKGIGWTSRDPQTVPAFHTAFPVDLRLVVVEVNGLDRAGKDTISTSDAGFPIYDHAGSPFDTLRELAWLCLP
jgi:hypothetical protein